MEWRPPTRSTVGDEADRPAIATASIGAPLVDRPMVQRSAANAGAWSHRQAKTQATTRRTRRSLAPTAAAIETPYRVIGTNDWHGHLLDPR